MKTIAEGVYERTGGKPHFLGLLRTKGRTFRKTFHYGSHPLQERSTALREAKAWVSREKLHVLATGQERGLQANVWVFRHLLERYVDEVEGIKPSDRQYRNLGVARVLLGRATNSYNITTHPLILDKKITEITTQDWKELYTNLLGRDGKLAPLGGRRRFLSAIGGIFRYCKETWHIDMPRLIDWEALKFAKPTRGRYVYMDGEEWQSIQDALNVTSKSIQAAIYFARYTGARRGEVVKLNWEDINFKDKTAKLRDTKSHDKEQQPRDREIPVPQRVIDRLIELMPEVPKGKKLRGAVFRNTKNEGRLGASRLTREWTKARAVCGLQHINLHDTRSVRITELVALLSNPLMVAKIAGNDIKVILSSYYNPRAKELGAMIARGEAIPTAKMEEAEEVLSSLSLEQLMILIARVTQKTLPRG